MIVSKTYLGVPGSYNVDAPELVNVIILGVKREGKGFNVLDGEIPVVSGQRACDYLPGTGRLRFGDAFINPDLPDTIVNIYPYLEKVWVMLKVP